MQKERLNGFSYDYYEKSGYWYTDERMILLYKAKLAMIEDFFVDGSCIEFGAADGHFLNLIHKRFPHFFLYYNELVDLLPLHYANLVPKQQRLIGPFEIVSAIDGQEFQNVVFLDVFEHIKKPHDIMRGLTNITSSGSRVLILTNNGDAICAENALLHYFEHMNIYTQKSILELVKPYPFGIFFYFAHKEKTIIILERV